jgi:hypothetical protein
VRNGRERARILPPAVRGGEREFLERMNRDGVSTVAVARGRTGS